MCVVFFSDIEETKFLTNIYFVSQCLRSQNGAVLSQEDEINDNHLIAYFSKKLLPRERYSTAEKECFAIKLVTLAFCIYLLVFFNCYTD